MWSSLKGTAVALCDIAIQLRSPADPPVGTSILLILAGLILIGGCVAFAIFRLRRPTSPYLLIGTRKLSLTRAMTLGRNLWPGASDGELTDDYAQIEPDGEGAWVVTVPSTGFMLVDGLRSRRNQLRPGTQVTLGPAGQATFTFVDPRQAEPRGKGGTQR
jgi:hypothetical protein